MIRLRRPRTFAALASLLVLAVAGSACGVFGADSDYTVSAEFERTYNLFPGSPVRVLGVHVGKISDLHIEPGADVVTVDMLIDGDVDIPADAGALVVPESLLGERYVQFEPAYTGGETLEPGATIGVERTAVPFEFDEVLEGLNQFVGGLDAPEVGRLFDNLATVLDGQGGRIGEVIDQAHDAVKVLKDNDEELVSLAGRLADLNTTLGTRDQALGEIIDDWNTVTGTLASDRTDIDAALRGLVRLTDQLGSLLATHRTNLQADIDTLTRIGRSADRNIDNLSLLILGSAELFRHAERVIDREHNWLPLQNHGQEIGPEIAKTISARLAGLCERSGIPEEECDELGIEDIVGGELCFDPIAPCPDDGSTKTIAQAVRDVFAASPEFRDAVAERRAEQRQDRSDDESDDAPDDVTSALIERLLGGDALIGEEHR
jgi:phospholipid/cholesterol/gamma-HCH transport system substrate-binding protein